MEKFTKFFGDKWTEELKDFLESPQFEVIGTKLRAVKKTGLNLTPEEKNIFKAFLLCPWEKLHTVILSSHPYVTCRKEKEPISDGLAFSTSDDIVAPRLLTHFYTGIDKELYNFEHPSLGALNNLSNLAKQGVLLLNCSLTAGQGRFDLFHYNIWKPFISFVLKRINQRKDAMGFILLGDPAKEFQDLLDNTSYGIFQAEHPQAAITENREWNSNNVFIQLTGYHKALNNITIKWG